MVDLMVTRLLLNQQGDQLVITKLGCSALLQKQKKEQKDAKMLPTTTASVNYSDYFGPLGMFSTAVILVERLQNINVCTIHCLVFSHIEKTR